MLNLRAQLKRTLLSVAELIDTFRVVPRIILCAYAYMVYYTVEWYMAYPLTAVIKCEAAVLDVLLKNGQTVELAKQIACQSVDVIAHPAGYTILVSTIIGAASVVFGLYTNTGRKWVPGTKSTPGE